MSLKQSHSAVISGIGLFTPENIITNAELVAAHNAWAEKYNRDHAQEIEIASLEAKQMSSEAFIVKASGIRQRYAYVKDGILDIDRMRPRIPERPETALSDQAGMALQAARDAIEAPGKSAADIDAVVVSCAYTQRSYPAIAIEVQNALAVDDLGVISSFGAGYSIGSLILRRFL